MHYPKEILNNRLILGGKWDGNSDGSDILDGIGGASIGSEALKALAEGFQNRKGNAIVTIGEGNIDIISNLKKVRVKKLVKMKLSNLTKNFTFRMLLIEFHLVNFIKKIVKS